MGGGTTTIGVFVGGNLVFTDVVPVGGAHVTNDIARGLSTPLAHAERMKALFGSAISSTLDEREMIAVPQIGEEEDGHAKHVPKSMLVSIVAPRVEETFEMVRNRLEAGGSDKIAGRRVVLTGGACQLHGVRELAGLILDKQVRIGRPTRISGLAEATTARLFGGGRAIALCGFERIEPPRRSRPQMACLAAFRTGCARIFDEKMVFLCLRVPPYGKADTIARASAGKRRQIRADLVPIRASIVGLAQSVGLRRRILSDSGVGVEGHGNDQSQHPEGRAGA